MKSKLLKSFIKFSAVVILVLLIHSFGEAQSGRRAPNPTQPPVPTPTPTESVQPPPAQNKPALKQTLIVGMDATGGSSYIPSYWADAAWGGFVERFRDISSVTISGDRNMRRKEASDLAKKETESFVVLLQLETLSAGASMGQANPDDLTINYIIYTPGTGKVKNQGRVYVRQARGILTGRLPGSRTIELQLAEAGRETADRVAATLHLASPPITP